MLQAFWIACFCAKQNIGTGDRYLLGVAIVLFEDERPSRDLQIFMDLLPAKAALIDGLGSIGGDVNIVEVGSEVK